GAAPPADLGLVSSIGLGPNGAGFGSQGAQPLERGRSPNPRLSPPRPTGWGGSGSRCCAGSRGCAPGCRNRPLQGQTESLLSTWILGLPESAPRIPMDPPEGSRTGPVTMDRGAIVSL